MRRWLAILCLLAGLDLAVAATARKSSDIPILSNLLSLFTPARTPAWTGAHGRHAARSPHVHVAEPKPASPRGGIIDPESTSAIRQPVSPPTTFVAEPATTSAVTQTAAPAVAVRSAEQFIEPPAAAAAEPAIAPAGEEPAVVRPRSPGGDSRCGDGQRIVSAYYWEGRHTASGQPFDPHGMTAAHRTLPFGTHLTVLNPRNGRSVTVIINDRGPYTHGVSLDLSLGAAQAIGMKGTGVVCLL